MEILIKNGVWFGTIASSSLCMMRGSGMSDLLVTLFGPMRVLRDEQVVLDGGLGKPWALFAYLLIEADRPHSRERLASLFWPDQPDTNARQSLRWALTTLRRSIADAQAEPPFLLVQRDSLQANRAAAMQVDFWQFERLLADDLSPVQLEALLDLVRGDMLEGASFADCEQFEEWLTQLRQQVHSQVCRVLAQACQGFFAQGDYAALERYALAWLEHEPWDEQAHRFVMQALAASGRRNAALQQYEQCKSILLANLGVEPELETQELFQQIRQHLLRPEPVLSLPLPSADAPVVMRSSLDAQQATPPVASHRDRMLQQVRRFWVDGVLHGPDAQRPYVPFSLEVEPGPGHPLPANARRDYDSIMAMFDAYNQDLLIVGAAGAGKTQLVLELARELLARASDNPALPIPVVFNLGYWDRRNPDLFAWLLHELQARYQVGLRVAREWLEQGQVLPLIDGFDELLPNDYAICLAAIRQFRQQHWLAGMVICCRSSEADAVLRGIPLCGVVRILPLQPAQIDALVAGLAQAQALQALFASDASWYELASTPLTFHLLSVTASSPNFVASLPASKDIEYELCSHYVQAMLERSGGQRFASAAQQRHWLTWFAVGLQRQHTPLFRLEQLDMSWFRFDWQRRLLLVLECFVLSLLFALVAVFDFASTLVWSHGWGVLGSVLPLGLGVGLLVGAGLGLLPLVFPAFARGKGWLVEHWCSLLVAFSSGANFFFFGMLFEPWWSALLSALTIALLLGGIVDRMRAYLFVPVGRFHWSIGLARKKLVWILLVALVVGLVFWWGINWVFGLSLGASLAIMLSLSAGLHSAPLEQRFAPWDGLRSTAWGAVQASVLIASLISILFVMLFGLFEALTLPASSETLMWRIMRHSFGPGLLGLLLGALCFGAWACLRHVLVRLLLWRANQLPLRLVRFLEHVTNLHILQRAGGGYAFAHHLLGEYFVAQETKES